MQWHPIQGVLQPCALCYLGQTPGPHDPDQIKQLEWMDGWMDIQCRAEISLDPKTTGQGKSWTSCHSVTVHTQTL